MTNNGIYNINNNTIYASGDIHGDSFLLRHILVDLAKVVDVQHIGGGFDDGIHLDELSWKKNNDSYLVFCGDLIDRKRLSRGRESRVVDNEDSDYKILNTLFRLKKEAKQEGGDIVLVIGNHELMNFNKDYRYATNKNISSRKNIFNFNNKELCNKVAENMHMTAQINTKDHSWFFVHGGFTPQLVDNTTKYIEGGFVEGLNTEFKSLFEEGKNQYIQNRSKKKYSTLFNSEHGSVLWNRDLGVRKTCDNLDLNDLFYKLGSNHPQNSRIVVAHCLQETINGICGDRIYRVDCGASRAYDDHFKDLKERCQKNGDCASLIERKYQSNWKSRKMQILKIKNGTADIETHGIKAAIYYEARTNKKSESALRNTFEIINNNGFSGGDNQIKYIAEDINQELAIAKSRNYQSKYAKVPEYFNKYIKYKQRYMNLKKNQL